MSTVRPEIDAVPRSSQAADAAALTKLFRAELPDDGEQIHVQVRLEQDRELPDLLLWDGGLWAVREIVDHTVARPGPAGSLAEHVWWVVAAAGRNGSERVFVLGQGYPGGQWRLRSVLGELSAACG